VRRQDLLIATTLVLSCIVTFQALRRAGSVEDHAPWEAVKIGRQFLDDRGYATGRILSSRLEEREPNYYWHDVFEIKSPERPDIKGLRRCWVIRFEQAKRPGHFFEVWIDAAEHLVIGGAQCR
jgi:hypothetical protein